MKKFSELRAVVADDADVSRRRTEKLLSDLGIALVGQASTGLQAVQRCISLRPDLLVLDLVMPELGGVDVIRLVRSRLDTRIVVVTSLCDTSLHARCQALGAGSVLVKPLSADDLKEVLRMVFPQTPRSNSAS